MTDYSTPSIAIAPHPLLDVRCFWTTYAEPLGSTATDPSLLELLSDTAAAPMQRDEDLRLAIRDLLRQGGYKPTGRGKPASEYLVRAAETDKLGSINPAVDACNVVSLHSGLPISVIDLARTQPPYRIAVAPKAASYVFNPSGQEIDLGGLLCLFDHAGPCGNAVRDSQRTKTSASTTKTLSVIWGTREYAAALDAAGEWYADILRSQNADVATVVPAPAGTP